ncbi:MAG: hypothetical protein JWM09_1338 [Francisellaceae bacterium]|nr:hypothetical protein [Francisellaceae bacterium]
MSNWLDYSIVIGILLSTIMGLFRGFVKEAISTITWIGALAIGILNCDKLSEHFTSISVPGIRLFLAFLLLVLATLIIGGICNYILSRLVSFTGLGPTDMVAGMLFGLARGVSIISAMVLLVQLSFFNNLKSSVIWKEARLIPPFITIANWMAENLPEDIVQRIKPTDPIKNKPIEKSSVSIEKDLTQEILNKIKPLIQ